MSNTAIEISEALQFYMESDVNANAIQQIVDIKTKNNYTAGMTWEEIESINNAKAAAVKTQVDYWSFLNRVWEATWGEAIAGLKGSISEVDADTYGKERSLESVWNDGFIRKDYTLPNGTLSLSVFSDDDANLGLSFYFEDTDGKYTLSNQVVLSNVWQEEPEHDERVTTKNFMVLRNKKEVDVENAKNAAQEALEKLLMKAGMGNLIT